LRRSLGTERTAPALNDLAWLLARKGEYGEAEKMAREAIELNDKLYQAHDTLGVIMMKSKRLDEAEKAFSKALSIYDGNPDVQMNMAELQAAKGNKTQALKIVGKLAEKRTQFSEESQQRLDELSRRFRNM
jgi:Flp pilus assembly protein TadD